MELIYYRDIELNIIQSIAWEREPLHDQAGGTTYECTRVRGSVIVTYNPGAISYKFSTSTTVPSPSAGYMPAETDEEIRRFLEQPRGKLYVVSAERVWLESPVAGRTCDVRNGPFVRVESIVKIPGERMWQIHLEIETFINEFPASSGSSTPPLIISNRWYASDDTNWQHLRTRTYVGTCTVRGDVLQTLDGTSKFIDSLRGSFAAFSIPPGFQREKVQVTVTPDGNTAHYTVVDAEQLFNKSSVPQISPVRIDVSETSYFWFGGAGRISAARGGIMGMTGRLMGSLFNLSAGSIFGGVAAELNGGAAAVSANLPKAYRSIIVQCWGNQRTKRVNLVNYALAVLSTRMGNAFSVIGTNSSEFILSQDTNNYVKGTLTIEWGMDTSTAFLGPLNPTDIATSIFSGGLTNAQQQFTNSVTANPNVTAGGISLSQSTPLLSNVKFPSNDGTRGTASLAPSTVGLQTLLTQTLEGFNEAPASVP
jgi:hypothetical protein